MTSNIVGTANIGVHSTANEISDALNAADAKIGRWIVALV